MKEALCQLTEKALNRVVARLEKSEIRLEQIKMAQFIMRFLDFAKTPGHTAIVEAGTGVGKSLGYLVPLCEHIKKSQILKLYATNTINLQDNSLKRYTYYHVISRNLL